MNEFAERLRSSGEGTLRAAGVKILQLNLGYRCNMACKHCHIEAGPARQETMERGAIEQALAAALKDDGGGAGGIETLDLTGGAPELNPHFRFLVAEARKERRRVIVRSNLTIFFEEGMADLPAFYREQEVEVVASLPTSSEASTDRVRGDGAFHKSIASLRKLNGLGYGREERLRLYLVYNPMGAFLPACQADLEARYRRELYDAFGIVFTGLYAFANMPVGRFKEFLLRSGNLKTYMDKIRAAFNPATLGSLMCRSLLSVGPDGTLYDCDFNQALGLTVDKGCPQRIGDYHHDRLASREISTGAHCFVCAAGQGST